MKIEPGRAGDPSRLIADASKAFKVLGWKPAFTELETIIRTAWDWKQKHPQGYSGKSLSDAATTRKADK
jgi:UDP-glucose 4-epimerase